MMSNGRSNTLGEFIVSRFAGFENKLNALINPDTCRIWVGFSGGLDSTVLLYFCSMLKCHDRVTAVHVNHGLQAAADDWQRHCARQTERLGVDFITRTVKPDVGNIEHEARRVRYKAFGDLVSDGDLVLTAHHRDDDVETLLWQLFTGRALVGIRETRSLGNGRLCRPFLSLSREDIQRIAHEVSLDWIEDFSNVDTKFDRNFLRHSVLPNLIRRFPDLQANVSKFKLDEPSSREPEPLMIERDTTNEKTTRAWLWSYGIVPRNSVVREIQKQMHAREDSTPVIDVFEDTTVRRYRGSLHVVKSQIELQTETIVVGVDWVHENGCLRWLRKERGLAEGRRYTATSRLSLNARSIKVGSCHRRINKLFQQHGVPPWNRDTWPIICDQNNPIIVPGITEVETQLVDAGFSPIWIPRTIHDEIA